jgi:hypothetical protein
MVESVLVRTATIISINNATQAGVERNPTVSKDDPPAHGNNFSPDLLYVFDEIHEAEVHVQLSMAVKQG